MKSGKMWLIFSGLLFSNTSFATVSSKCLDQFNLVLSGRDSDSNPIPVECQYYKMSELDPLMQKKVRDQIHSDSDTKADFKLSSILATLKNSYSVPPVGEVEVQKNKITSLQPEVLTLHNSMPQEPQSSASNSSTCETEAIELSTAPRTSIEVACMAGEKGYIIPGKVYFADDVLLYQATTIVQDGRWCCVDKSKKVRSCEDVMDGIRMIPDGVGTNQDELGKDGPWTPEKSGNMLTDKACRAGKYSFKTAIKSVNLEILSNLKYFVPVKDWKSKKKNTTLNFSKDPM